MPRPGTPVFPLGSVAVGRELSVAGMPDRCLIEEEAEPGAFDPETGLHATGRGWTEVEQPPGVADAAGVPCRIHPVPLNEDRHTLAERDTIVSRYYARLPLGTIVEFDQRIRVVSVDPETGDPKQVGRVYRVLDPTATAYATEARVTVKEEEVVG